MALADLLPNIVDRPKPAEPRPEFASLSDAGSAIIERETNNAEIAELVQCSEEVRTNLARIQTESVDKLKTLDDQVRALHRKNERCDRARRFVIHQTKPTAEETAKTELGKRLQRQVLERRIRYAVNSTTMQAPDESQGAKRLSEVLEIIKQDEKTIASEEGAPGHSGASFRLRKMTRERDTLEGELQRQRVKWEHFQEIQAIKAEAESAFAERDKLRAAREEKALTDAIKLATK